MCLLRYVCGGSADSAVIGGCSKSCHAYASYSNIDHMYQSHASITCVSYLCILCMFHPYVLHVVTYDVKLNKVFVISPICVWSFRHSHWWPLYHLMHMHRINTSIICVLYSRIDHICITYVYPMHVPAIGTSCRHL